MAALYNEIDPDAAHVLRALISEGVIAPGVVDTRSIKELTPDDVKGFTQVHFFAGGGLWSVAARLAGWPDDRPLWTGSCPCQPFSAAGKGGGVDDPRHLWPDFFRLIRACRPPVVMGEQVAGAPGYGWFDGVRADLAGEDYASRCVDVPACAVDAPHIRQRLYWVALEHAESERRGEGRPEHELRSRRPALAGADAQGERKNRNNQLRYHRIRREVLAHYSDGDIRCACCGERGYEFLSLDHVDGGGAAEKRRAGSRMRFRHIQIAGYPAGYQVLCHNCNQAKHIYGQCPHQLVGDAFGPRLEGQPRHGDGGGGRPGSAGSVAPADGGGLDVADADPRRRAGRQEDAQRGSVGRDADERPVTRNGSFWSDAEWLACHDGKARRTKPGLRLLVDGLPGRVGLWRIAGNAIVAPLAAEVIAAFLDAERAAA